MDNEHTVLIVYDDGEELTATLRDCGAYRAGIFARHAMKMPAVRGVGVYPGGNMERQLIDQEGDFPYA